MFKDGNIAIIGIIVIAIGYYIFRQGKKSGNIAPLPNGGNGIPQGWSPRPVTEMLKQALNPSGISYMSAVDGTDEEQIWNALFGLTDDQLASVYNDYNNYTGGNLLDDFRSELSGEELMRALAYFSFIGQNKWSADNLYSNVYQKMPLNAYLNLKGN